MRILPTSLVFILISILSGCGKPTIDSQNGRFDGSFDTTKQHLLIMIEKCWIEVDRLWWGTALWIKERSDNPQESTIELWSEKGSGPVLYIYLSQANDDFLVNAEEQKHEVAQYRDFPAEVMHWAAGNKDCPDAQ